MKRYGILVDYDFCCGCHTCEVACQKEHGYVPGQRGIYVQQVGPFAVEGAAAEKLGAKRKVYDCMPMLTDLCDLCTERTDAGKLPTCVHHCQTGCMTYGPVEGLVAQLAAAGCADKYALLIP